MATVSSDLASLMMRQLDTGVASGRITFTGKDRAFAWCGDRLNATIAYVDTGVSDSTHFTAVRVNNEQAVTAWTEGDKPVTATITAEAITLSTFPGVVEVTTAQILDSAGLASAVQIALYGQALRALDAALITELLGDGPTINDAADLAAIATAQASLMADGFNPNLTVVSPSLYADLAGGALLAGANNPQAMQQAVLGSRLLVSSALAGAQAIVLDSTAVVAVEHAESPVVLMETHARSNTLDVVVEVIGGWVISKPSGVAAIWLD